MQRLHFIFYFFYNLYLGRRSSCTSWTNHSERNHFPLRWYQESGRYGVYFRYGQESYNSKNWLVIIIILKTKIQLAKTSDLFIFTPTAIHELDRDIRSCLEEAGKTPNCTLCKKLVVKSTNCSDPCCGARYHRCCAPKDVCLKERLKMSVFLF